MRLEALPLAQPESREDDELAEAIATLTPQEADTLWSVVIQLKPHLRD